MISKTKIDNSIPLAPTDTIKSVWGDADAREQKNFREDSRYREFSEAFRRIENLCVNNKLELSVALLMINRAYKWTWDTVPHGEIDNVYEFLRKNITRAYTIVWPEYAAELRGNMQKMGMSYSGLHVDI